MGTAGCGTGPADATIVTSGEAPEAVLDAALESARAQTDRTETIALADVFDFALLRAARQETAKP